MVEDGKEKGMKLEVGKVYEDASGVLVAMVAQHPWKPGIYIGVRKEADILLSYWPTGLVADDRPMSARALSMLNLVREHKPKVGHEAA